MTASHPVSPLRLSRSDHKTLSLAALGGALEIYDFIIFVFFTLTLSQLFFPPQMPEWLRLLQSFGIQPFTGDLGHGLRKFRQALGVDGTTRSHGVATKAQ